MRRWIPLLFAALGIAGLAVALTSGHEREVTLSRFVTPLIGRTEDQRHNAILSLKRLDGAVIGPGEVLSFNSTVGAWSRDKGYRRAPVSFGGLLVDSWGGGVCQTSSTLYNAALLAGLEVVERHRHHYAPTYVAPGRDAAVAFPNIDLQIRNPFDRPVRVTASVSPSGLRLAFVASGVTPRAARIEQRVTDVARPRELEIGSGRFGRVRNPGHAGFSVETYRVVGGVRELLSIDHYPVMNKVIEHKGASVE